MPPADSDQPTAHGIRGGPGHAAAGPLRSAALAALVAGGPTSVGLMLWAFHRNPSLLLLAFFVVWDLSPFVALLWADRVSQGWPAAARAMLHAATLVLALGTVAIYVNTVLHPPSARPAFAFIAVPPVSWVLMTVVFAIGALVSRRQTRRDAGT